MRERGRENEIGRKRMRCLRWRKKRKEEGNKKKEKRKGKKERK
jgi:hypothetical protein